MTSWLALFQDSLRSSQNKGKSLHIWSFHDDEISIREFDLLFYNILFVLEIKKYIWLEQKHVIKEDERFFIIVWKPMGSFWTHIKFLFKFLIIKYFKHINIKINIYIVILICILYKSNILPKISFLLRIFYWIYLIYKTINLRYITLEFLKESPLYSHPFQILSLEVVSS